MSEGAIDGFIHSFRENDDLAQASNVDAPHTGGYGGDSINPPFVADFCTPPGLVSNMPHDLAPTTNVAPFRESVVIPNDLPTDEPNPWVGTYRPEIDPMDLALPEGDIRDRLYGRDDWFVPILPSSTPIAVEFVTADDKTRLAELVNPYIQGINEEIHADLLNWLDFQRVTEEGDFGALLSDGLWNLFTHGDSAIRQHASSSLDRLKCIDSFHAGEGGICRITWGQLYSRSIVFVRRLLLGRFISHRQIMGIP